MPPPRTVRLLVAGLALAGAIWLGYAIGRGQSLMDMARLYRDQTVSYYTLDTGQMVAQFARNSGDLKPLLRTPDGTSLVDFSDWDYGSNIIVDGARYELVRLVPTSSVDYERRRIVHGLRATDWQLGREVVIKGAEAVVKFTFMADAPVRDVRFTMAHTNWYYLSAAVSSTGFSAMVARASRQEIETGVIRTPAFEVSVQSASSAPPVPNLARLGTTTSYGIQSIITEYQLREPVVGQILPIAEETVTYRKL